jgi:DNA-binding NarL/FixJ family response regulator
MAHAVPPSEPMIRVLIADDHAAVRRALHALLAGQPGLAVCAEAVDGDEAVALALQHRPDVVVLDLVMPGLSGIEATRRLRALLPDTEIALVTMHQGDEIERAARGVGARAFLNKSEAEAHLAAAVRALAAHQPYFVARPDDAAAPGWAERVRL